MAGPTLFRPSNITSGLVGYWKLDEASGSRADSSGNGNTLTDNNTVASVAQDYWKTGENSADFERGNTEYLSIADGSQTGLDLTGEFTLAFWCKLESASGTNNIIRKETGGTGYFIQHNTGQLDFRVQGNEFLGPTLSVGKWTHVVVSRSTTFKSIYIDGNLVSQEADTGAASNTSAAFCVGADSSGADTFDGLLKDVAVWNVALTPIQVKSLALGVDLSTYAYRPNNVSTLPTAWWKLNELSGNRADSIGSLTLTDNNTVAAAGGYVEGVGADFEAGNSEYLSSADNTAFDFSGGIFSVSAWIKPESLAADVPFYCNLTDGSNFLRIGTLATGALECVVFSGGGAVVNVTTATAIVKTGTWHHVAVTESGDTWKIYLDGVDVTSGGGTDTSRAANYTGQLEICRRADAGAFWDGVVFDLAIWKGYTLTDAEVASLACGIPLQQTGVVSYWKLDETSGTRADSIGSNNLTDNNTVLSGTGKVSNAADFEASNSEYLSIADASQSGLDLNAEDLTMLCWYNLESAGEKYLLSKWVSGSGYRLSVNTSEINFYLANATEINQASTTTTGVWYHIALTFTPDADRAVLYKDSAVIATDASAAGVIADNVGAFVLGARSDADSPYDGLMDEALIAKRWFRDEEIKTIYCKGLCAKELTSEERAAALGRNQILWMD